MIPGAFVLQSTTTGTAVSERSRQAAELPVVNEKVRVNGVPLSVPLIVTV